MIRRSPLALALVLGVGLVLGGSLAGGAGPVRNVATSQAFAIKIVIPGQAGAITGSVAAPPPNDSVGFGAGFSYPQDGSVLTSGSVTSSASVDPSQTATASASAEVTDLSLFGGEVTVQRVDAKVRTTAGAAGGSGDFTGTGVVNIGGSAVVGNQLGDWGMLTVGAGTGAPTDTAKTHGWHGDVVALDVTLTQDHGGLPAGSEILVGYAEATVQASAVAATAPGPTPLGAKRGPASKNGGNTPRQAGITATTSSRPWARRRSPSQTASCSPSAGTRSAAGVYGWSTGRETSSTTRTSPRTPRLR